MNQALTDCLGLTTARIPQYDGMVKNTLFSKKPVGFCSKLASDFSKDEPTVTYPVFQDETGDFPLKWFQYEIL